MIVLKSAFQTGHYDVRYQCTWPYVHFELIAQHDSMRSDHACRSAYRLSGWLLNMVFVGCAPTAFCRCPADLQLIDTYQSAISPVTTFVTHVFRWFRCTNHNNRKLFTVNMQNSFPVVVGIFGFDDKLSNVIVVRLFFHFFPNRNTYRQQQNNNTLIPGIMLRITEIEWRRNISGAHHLYVSGSYHLHIRGLHHLSQRPMQGLQCGICPTRSRNLIDYGRFGMCIKNVTVSIYQYRTKECIKVIIESLKLNRWLCATSFRTAESNILQTSRYIHKI